MDYLIVSAVLSNLIPDCSVITANSGTEGISKARTELPDTILLDIKMPEMDGFEVCRRLKDDEKTRHIPIVVLTAVRMDSKSRTEMLELGADAFLLKSYNELELIDQVNVMLRIKKAEDDLRTEKDALKQSEEPDIPEELSWLQCVY